SAPTRPADSPLKHALTPNQSQELVVRVRFAWCFFFTDPAPTEFYTLSLHDALPIFRPVRVTPRSTATAPATTAPVTARTPAATRSEEHTSELQSPCNLVCRLLLEKKNELPGRNRPLRGAQAAHRGSVPGQRRGPRDRRPRRRARHLLHDLYYHGRRCRTRSRARCG